MCVRWETNLFLFDKVARVPHTSWREKYNAYLPAALCVFISVRSRQLVVTTTSLVLIDRPVIFKTQRINVFFREREKHYYLKIEMTEKLDQLTSIIIESSVLRETHRCCNDVTWKLPLGIAHAGAINTRSSREQCLKALTVISIH